MQELNLRMISKAEMLIEILEQKLLRVELFLPKQGLKLLLLGMTHLHNLSW